MIKIYCFLFLMVPLLKVFAQPYQPLEDQRLSTISAVKFSNLNIVNGGYLRASENGTNQGSITLQYTGSGSTSYGSLACGDANVWRPIILNPIAGYVGIGTTSPRGSLDVNGSIYTNSLFRAYENGSNQGSVSFQYNNSGSTAYASIAAGDAIYWRPIILNPTAGNVGIGTINPKATLDVNGAIYSNDIIAAWEKGINQGRISLQYNYSGSNAYASISAGDSYNYRPIILNPTAGNVGIGTSTPNDVLEVAGNVYANGAFNSIGGISRYNSTGGIFITGYSGSNYAEIRAYKDGTGIGKSLTLQSTGGKVGIGTTNPAFNLDVSGNANVSNTLYIGPINPSLAGSNTLAVNGSAIINKVIVKPYPWADYVFDNDYKNINLQELEKFIKLNHHLPEIPSAKEVEKDGIDLGSNQSLLLKKIEELTVIIIEQNKRMIGQDTILRDLKKRISLMETQNHLTKK